MKDSIKTVKFLAISITLMLSGSFVNAQEGSYIETDSTLLYGINLLPGNNIENARFIRVYRNGKTVEYSPDQLKGYGIKNGAAYQSRTIPFEGAEKRVFLEILSDGQLKLYYYETTERSTYFLERDSSSLVELTKNNYRTLLSDYTMDFPSANKQVLLARYNKKSLSKLVSQYNSNLQEILPFNRFGINCGYRLTYIKLPIKIHEEQLRGVKFASSETIAFGIFAELPINMSHVSFNAGANFSKASIAVESTDPEASFDLVANLTSLSIPLLLRISSSHPTWRPYVNTGGLISFHLQSESKIFESTFEDQLITINELDLFEPLVSNIMLGYSIGAGVQRNLNYRTIVTGEVRYNNLFGNSSTIIKRQIEFLISFSI